MKGVTFVVGENEVLSILGQSGAGKTTMFKMLAMSEARDSGSIKMFGKEFTEVKDIDDLVKDGQISLVFQEDVLWHDLTVDQNLALMAKIRGIDPKSKEIQTRLKFLKILMRL